MMKLCTECAHAKSKSPVAASLAQDWLCRNPIIAAISPVDGSQVERWCYLERGSSAQFCGPAGRLWEKKP